MDIRSLAGEISPYIIERRRFYHRRPELSFRELETTRALAEDVRALGLQPRTFGDLPGLTAELEGAKPGPCVLLRADIDALPVDEKTGLPFASETPGVMHACGHDAHIAMLLGAMRLLIKAREKLRGSVRFFFQAGEETGKGARKYIDRGVLEGVDAVFGLHVWGTVDAPLAAVGPGRRMASMDNFRITVTGKQAHGAAPQDGRDAIVAASAVVLALQTFASRRNDPLNPFVLTVGTFHGGAMYNIICPEVELTGSVRTYSRQLREALPEELERIVQSAAEACGCEAALEFEPLLPPIINDNEKVNRTVYGAARKLFGPEGITQAPPLMSSDDFSLLAARVPGYYALLGTRDAASGFDAVNHSERFSVDEDILWRGSALAAQFALDFAENE